MRKGDRIRRDIDILAFCGANGSGKTLLAVGDAVQSLDAGRPVLSTVRLLGSDGQAHPLWIPMTGWDTLLDAEHCDVLMDEVSGVASARASMSLPGPVEVLLQQLRKRDIKLRWTAPSWQRADRVIRECTQAVVLCYSMFRSAAVGQHWRTTRLLKARLVDARDLDDLTDGVKQRAPALHVDWVRVSRYHAKSRYDTLEQVMSLPTVEGGRCARCGGRRRIPTCTCTD